jgi:perosamine synthetase
MTEMIPAAKPIIGDDEREAVDRVLRTGMIASGPEVAAFESEFSELVSGRHSIAVNSGTSALHMAFLAAGIESGDEVIVPSFTFAATANSVVLAGRTPVFAGILQANHIEYLKISEKDFEGIRTVIDGRNFSSSTQFKDVNWFSI